MSEDMEEGGEVVETQVNLYREGHKIAQRRNMLLDKDIWSYEDFKWGYLILNDYLILDNLQDPTNSSNNMINEAFAIYEMIKNYSVDEITVWLEEPVNTNMIRNSMLFNFNKAMKTMSPQVREGVLGYAKPEFVDYFELSPYFWCKWMGMGNTGVQKGEKGSGKTDHLWNVADNFLKWEELNDNGDKIQHAVMGNMLVHEDLPWYSYYTKYSQVMLIRLRNAKKRLHTFDMRDEMKASGMRKKTAMSGASMGIEQDEALTRKFFTDTCYVWHYDTEIPTELYPILAYNGKKFGNNTKEGKRLRKTGIFTFRIGGQLKTTYVKNMPSTKIKFETNDIAPFDQDIKLLDVMKGMEDLEHAKLDYDVMIDEMVNVVKRLAQEAEEDKKERKKK
jgi:hypothetical protein